MNNTISEREKITKIEKHFFKDDLKNIKRTKNYKYNINNKILLSFQMEKKIQEGISLIKIWIIIKKQEFKNNNDFSELEKIVKEIEKDKDYSNDAYEDIRYLLRPFEYIPLKIKRIFNIGTLDNYTMFIASRHFESIDDFINLEMGIKRFNGNMTKFHYNPISLTNTTRNFFDHVQTLFIYSPKQKQMEALRSFLISNAGML